MSHKGPSLADAGNMAKFRLRLGACEYAAKSRNLFTEGQERFIKDMRWQLEHREDNTPMVDAWNPTVGQWNYLGDLYEKAAR